MMNLRNIFAEYKHFIDIHKWLGNNRKPIHTHAKTGSGGIWHIRAYDTVTGDVKTLLT